jgi:hypothetical protein
MVISRHLLLRIGQGFGISGCFFLGPVTLLVVLLHGASRDAMPVSLCARNPSLSWGDTIEIGVQSGTCFDLDFRSLSQQKTYFKNVTCAICTDNTQESCEWGWDCASLFVNYAYSIPFATVSRTIQNWPHVSSIVLNIGVINISLGILFNCFISPGEYGIHQTLIK